MNEILKEKIAKLPSVSGVYLMKNAEGNIIYIGKAKILKNRVSSYFTSQKQHLKTSILVQNIVDFDYIVTASELDALILENNLIKKHQPYFNILLKDGKTYPYIKLTLKKDYPKLEVVRKIKKDGNKYFGPYLGGISPYSLIGTVNYAYAIKTMQSNKENVNQNWLNYLLGIEYKQPKISKKDYDLYVNGVVDFLNGKTSEVEKILTEKMHNAASIQNFETALRLREDLKYLERLKERFTTEFSKLVDMDVIGFYSSGIQSVMAVIMIRSGKMLGCDTLYIGEHKESLEELYSDFVSQYYDQDIFIPSEIVLKEEVIDKALLEEWLTNKKGKKVTLQKVQKGVKNKLLDLAVENAKEYLIRTTRTLQLKENRTIGALNLLKENLHLSRMPYRMECYDISNISGVDKVASMVVFINGEKQVKHYRKFKIKTVEGANDFASMEEVLTRRFQKVGDADESFSSVPDLVIIDGGKGQLSSAKKAIDSVEDFSFDLIGLAKREEEVFKVGNSTPYLLPKTSYGLQLLQRIRDEAHRFAITYHRSLRDKHINSVLDKIEGIGPKKRVALLKEFKTIKNIESKSVEELTKVKGITKDLAIKIQQFFLK